jgi:hypothetical protein
MELEVTFEAEGGTVIGTTSISIGDRSGGEGIPHAFIRLTDDGQRLEWGYLNPRGGGGMVVYSVTLEGNGDLVGVQEIRGFELALPEGFVIPVTHVTLVSPWPNFGLSRGSGSGSGIEGEDLRRIGRPSAARVRSDFG